MSNQALAAALREVGPIPPGRLSAARQVANTLRSQIVDGRLIGGMRLTEETISDALGFSRNTIREAFALLSAERLVVHRAHRGVFVAEPTLDDVRDVYATRRLIQPAAAEYGAHCTPEAIQDLRDIVEQGQAAVARGDNDAVAQANQLFHRRLTATAGSRRTSELMEDLLAEMRLVFRAMETDRGFHPHFLERNVRIVDLLERGERSAAATELRDYLDAAERRLVAVFLERS